MSTGERHEEPHEQQHGSLLPALLASPLPPPVSPDLAPPVPPAPRSAPWSEQASRTTAVPPAATQPDPDPETEPAPEPGPEPAPGPAPVSRATLLWEEDEHATSAARRRRTALVTLGVLLVLLAGATVGGVLALRAADAPRRADPTTAPAVGGTPAVVPPGTSRVTTTVRPDGSVVVRQRLRSREPLRRLVLGLPRVEGAGTLAATRVRVVADGVPVDGPDGVGPGGATYDLGSATDLRVSYRLAGVVLASGSSPGRALAVATSLDATTEPAVDQETRVVRAPRVLALACATPAGRQPVPCGTALDLGEWRVDLAGVRLRDRVIAQLTVPGLDGSA